MISWAPFEKNKRLGLENTLFQAFVFLEESQVINKPFTLNIHFMFATCFISWNHTQPSIKTTAASSRSAKATPKFLFLWWNAAPSKDSLTFTMQLNFRAVALLCGHSFIAARIVDGWICFSSSRTSPSFQKEDDNQNSADQKQQPSCTSNNWY